MFYVQSISSNTPSPIYIISPNTSKFNRAPQELLQLLLIPEKIWDLVLMDFITNVAPRMAR